MWTMQILVTNNKMKFAKENLNLEKGLNKEWVITNGLGGFASSTVAGANTRRYHGILVAPLNPPAQRYLLVSKVDESIDINGKTYPLYTNMCKNNISEGYKNLVAFEKEEVPTYYYNVEGIEIEKTEAILMASAIISDTLLLKSPTTTEKDKKALEALAKIADVDVNIYGLEMLKAGTNLDEYTEDELPALTIFLKKGTSLDHEWFPKKQIHDFTAARYYGVALTNAAKIVLAKFKK